MGFKEQWPLELGVNEWREAALKSAAKNLPPVLALRRVHVKELHANPS